MKVATVQRLRLLASALSVILLIALLVAGWFYFKLRATLPQLAGELSLTGLVQPVTVERDAAGVPTIRAANRTDAARALGFLHAQDRFFQMDLARRHAAGELAALFGKRALPHDRRVRIHSFRTLAQTVLARLSADERALVDAYTAGVNAGLSQLGGKPFEYLILRAAPQPWKPEDSLLMHYAMILDLQDDDGEYEQSIAAVRDTLGTAMLDYVAPLIGPDDAALDGTTAPLAPMPGEKVVDLRKRVYVTEGDHASLPHRTEWPEVLPGSNAFALAGAHTATGAALVANDMHLSLRVPNIWYRASIVYSKHGDAGETRVTGVTLPGTPVVIAGSNGHIAWGFTNAFADVSDLVVVTRSNAGPDAYSDRGELLRYEKRREIIEIKNEEPETIETSWTIWGPIVGKNADGRDLALKWTAHDPDAANLALSELEAATTVETAIDIAHRAGIPVQNFVVADRSGKIGWTLCGKLPRRLHFDGRLPVSWGFGDRGWDGFLSPDEIPSVIAPANGRIWSANQRHVSGDALVKLGDGGYERPLRAGRVRDGVMALEKATPKDLLAVQLDIRAPHLDRWHRLLQEVLNDDATARKKARRQLRAAIETWDGHASVDSVSYRIVAGFRRNVVDRVLPVIFEPCYQVYPNFNFRHFHYEAALWDMVEKKPAHLLGQDYTTWDDLFLAAADEVIKEIDDEHVSISKATWGRHNAAQIRHPLSSALGPLGRWLNMPADPLPGDNDVPRVQKPASGASERFVISPGHEAEGIFHMPGGQSGHPLSPFYRAGHDDWVHARPTPFLPGATAHTLVLKP